MSYLKKLKIKFSNRCYKLEKITVLENYNGILSAESLHVSDYCSEKQPVGFHLGSIKKFKLVAQSGISLNSG
jgi:hypothetical protein